MVGQYLVISWIIFSWLLLELQAKSLHSWVKYSWSELQPRIFAPPPENYLQYIVLLPTACVRIYVHDYSAVLIFLCRCSWVKINRTTYQSKNIIDLGASMSMPVFGEIISILVTDVTKCHFVCKVLLTEPFNPHYHAYEVERHTFPKPITVCSQLDFLDHHVLALYHVSNLNLIPLKYDPLKYDVIVSEWIIVLYLRMNNCFVLIVSEWIIVLYKYILYINYQYTWHYN